MSSSKEASRNYFQRLSSQLSPSRGSYAREDAVPAKPAAVARPAVPSRRPPDAILTQVNQAQPVNGPSRDGRLPAMKDTAEQRERLKRIKEKSKNLSPMIPSHYAPLLPRPLPGKANKKCLVLDVDETLVHSAYKPTASYDIHLTCEVNGGTCHIYVSCRPHLRDFLRMVKDMFEIVIFTASVDIYCNPLMDKLDPSGELGTLRLFRSHCSFVNGSYVKDLSLIGRPLDQIAIIDNSPVAYLFQPRNAIPILSWFDDPDDTELMKLMPMLHKLADAPDVYDVLDEFNSQIPLDTR